MRNSENLNCLFQHHTPSIRTRTRTRTPPCLPFTIGKGAKSSLSSHLLWYWNGGVVVWQGINFCDKHVKVLLLPGIRTNLVREMVCLLTGSVCDLCFLPSCSHPYHSPLRKARNLTNVNCVTLHAETWATYQSTCWPTPTPRIICALIVAMSLSGSTTSVCTCENT